MGRGPGAGWEGKASGLQRRAKAGGEALSSGISRKLTTASSFLHP